MKSKHKGVYWDKATEKWRGRVGINGKLTTVCTSGDEDECGEAVRRAIEARGEHEPIITDFLIRMKAERLKQGYGSREFARKAGVSQNYFIDIENGHKSVNQAMQAKLAGALGFEIVYTETWKKLKP